MRETRCCNRRGFFGAAGSPSARVALRTCSHGEALSPTPSAPPAFSAAFHVFPPGGQLYPVTVRCSRKAFRRGQGGYQKDRGKDRWANAVSDPRHWGRSGWNLDSIFDPGCCAHQAPRSQAASSSAAAASAAAEGCSDGEQRPRSVAVAALVGREGRRPPLAAAGRPPPATAPGGNNHLFIEAYACCCSSRRSNQAAQRIGHS